MKLHSRIFQFFLLLLPLQLNYFFWPDFAFVNGIRVDYLSPVIFFTDLIFIIFIVLWLVGKRINLSLKTLSITLLIVLPNIFLSQSPFSTTLNWMRIAQVVLLYFYVKENISKKNIIYPLVISFWIVAFIAVIQFITSRNIGGIFWWLGERPLNINQPGISLFTLGDKTFLRPYSIFPHPNSLAGYAGLLFLFLLKEKVKNRFVKYFSLFSSAFVILITFSQGVWIALLVSLISYFRKIKLSLIFIFFIIISLLATVASTYLLGNYNFSLSVSQRLELMMVAGKVIADHPLFGVGLGQFIREIPQQISSPIWWLQPIHNIYVSLAAEIGLVGLATFTVIFLNKLKKIQTINYALVIFVLVTAMVDHYWLTSHQNIMLLAVVFGTIKNNDFTHQQ